MARVNDMETVLQRQLVRNHRCADGINYLYLGNRIADAPASMISVPQTMTRRPNSRGALYRIVRDDGKPMTDADFERVYACDACYPTPTGPDVDRVGSRR